MARDTSRDGFKNKLRYYVLTHFGPLWRVANRWTWLRRRANRFLINNAVNQARNRPHPFSTLADYTSWESLTDKTYFGRHLPAKPWVEGMPEPEEVAKLFKPRGGVRRLSDKSTLLFPSFAQWFTDGFLLTMDKDVSRTHSNHEIDFCPLYGLGRKVTRSLRLLSEETGRRGRLKSQEINGEEYAPYYYHDDGKTRKEEFAEVPSPLRLPAEWPTEKKATLFAFGGERANSTPQTAMLNTLFLREHNRLAGLLERQYPNWDDERVFQTARNVVMVELLKIVVEEYVNHITPYHFQFVTDPSVAWDAKWNRPNWFTVEFNLLYRWHTLVPDAFDWPGGAIAGADWLLSNAPLTRAGLGPAFDITSRQKAGEVWLFNTPEFLLHTEVASIRQGRHNRLASYNDYRAAMGYPRVESFDQITGDPDAAAMLKDIYKSVDNVEFYVGLFAEDPRPGAAVPPLVGRMVALDAFSQALTNPLLSEHVFNADTFSPLGMETIENTKTLRDVLDRNLPGGAAAYSVTMTQGR